MLSLVDLELEADQTVYLFVDSFREAGRGPYTLNAGLAPAQP